MVVESKGGSAERGRDNLCAGLLRLSDLLSADNDDSVVMWLGW